MTSAAYSRQDAVFDRTGARVHAYHGLDALKVAQRPLLPHQDRLAHARLSRSAL